MSAHTLLAYTNDLKQFLSFLNNKTQSAHDINTNQIRSWMAEMMEQGVGSRSVHRKISTLRTFFQYLRSMGHISHDPMARVITPKAPKKIVQDIPAADLSDLFRSFPWNEHEEGERDRLIILILYTTGMRLSELLGLKVSDIDFKRKLITVTGKRNKQRLIPMHNELEDCLNHYLASHQHQQLITTSKGKTAYPMLIYRVVTRYINLFSTAMKTSPHVLRHSFATHMLNNGANLMAIKELLGHASLSATQVYTKNSFEKLKSIHKLHPRK